MRSWRAIQVLCALFDAPHEPAVRAVERIMTNQWSGGRRDYAAAVFLDDHWLDRDTTGADEERRKAIGPIDGKLDTLPVKLGHSGRSTNVSADHQGRLTA